MALIDLAGLTLKDALDVAHLIEEEGRRLYEDLGRRATGNGNVVLGTLWRSMGEIEAEHGKRLAARRKEHFGDAPPRVDHSIIAELEGPALGDAPVVSPRHALERAIAAEARARRFYADALTVIEDPEVRALFQELCDEEFMHGEILRHHAASLPAEV